MSSFRSFATASRTAERRLRHDRAVLPIAPGIDYRARSPANSRAAP
jgi:hypothetical protein